MNPQTHYEAGAQHSEWLKLDTLRRQHEERISQLLDFHRSERVLYGRQQRGFGILIGGVLSALVFVVAYLAGGAQWLK